MTQSYHSVQTTVTFVFLASGYKADAEFGVQIKWEELN